MTTHQLYIGGTFVDGSTVRENINPSDTTDIIGRYAAGGAEEIDAAIRAARSAAPVWAATTPQQRFDILDAIGHEIHARKKELGALLAREEGKTLPEAIGEVGRAGQIFNFFAGETLRIAGTRIDSVRPGVTVEVTREPRGVIGAITPWNFPIAIPAWKVAPALAYGNTVVLKPSELTPGSAHALASIIAATDLPPGAFNLVCGAGEAGAALAEHAGVDGVSFTGSVQTGRKVAASCVARMAVVQCEMGGKNPLVVLDDADLDTAVDCALNGAFYSTGQRCTASSRLIVTAGIHDRFVAALTEAMEGLVVGEAIDPATQIGPCIDQRQLDKNLEYLALAREEGVSVIGGGTPDLDKPGFYLRPALLTETENHMRINREEIFGPIASVIRVADLDQAIEVANDTDFGLSAGICSGDFAAVERFKREARVGMVMVNLPTAGVDFHVPFGGRGASSYGAREQGSQAIEFYTTVKTTYQKP